MNKAKLKSYAPSARRDFIQAVTDRAHFFGISEKQIVPVEVSGDVAIIGGRPFPRAVAEQRRKLDARIKRDGFEQVMEAVAYTWFNRLLALRYMELHGYLEHGYRVLSNPGSGNAPEILEQATNTDLPGLNKQKVVELKLDGSKDAELYRMLLVAQCNALHSAMPFLFERIEDETELLLPDNLLHSDSLIRKLVTEIEEEDWEEVEIIGWLYQFYIIDEKARIDEKLKLGKTVSSNEIPAKTQLFTPNWIVKFMVQNSLGRQWMATYPNSPLKAKMEYYIEPAEQTDEVIKQFKDITPDSLDPEKLTLLDPASGSGHILVEAYDVFKEIYLERGYSNRDFPRLILEKNLYGLDIDDRAAQMAGFALLMKARKDDRRVLRSDNPIKLNVMAVQESGEFSVDNSQWGELSNSIRELVELFRNGKTFGSLVEVKKRLADKLPEIKNAIKLGITNGDLYSSQTALELLPLVAQALVLAGKYDCVVANPPYMGSKGMNSELKNFAKSKFPDSKSDLFAMFIERGFNWCTESGFNAMVTMQSWMFLSSYEDMRIKLLQNKTLSSMVHMGNGVMGIAFGTAATVFNNRHINNYVGSFSYCGFDDLNDDGEPINFPIDNDRHKSAKSDEFKKISGSPIAYWVSNQIFKVFEIGTPLNSIARPTGGMTTGDNASFVRAWHEIDKEKSGFNFTDRQSAISSGKKWFPYNKGGAFRKWFGNNEYVVNWENDGEEIIASGRAFPRSKEYYFKQGITWTDISSSSFGSRYTEGGSLFDATGPSAFPNPNDCFICAGFLATKIAFNILKILNPTMHFQVGNIAALPLLTEQLNEVKDEINQIVSDAIEISKKDWNSYETSWEFQLLPCLTLPVKSVTIEASWTNRLELSQSQLHRLQKIETENNRIFIEAYGLQKEINPEVPEDQITLFRAVREKDMERLISYSIGCMMGRYSLDHPGLVYANSRNEGFDSTKYVSFPADDDGIVPVMDMEWFPDDAASRFEEFLKVAWSPETLEENLKFVAESLSPKGSETPRETIRRYMSTQFYKDHLQTYKKRPIYWLFSSGKLRSFECLVYLHRYNESTLSRMRNEYVTPLQGKFSAQVEYLASEVNAATSTAERNRLQKQLDTLRKKQVELAAFDDLLRHYADQRISLDLDDGVKVNYGKFGALLAEVKAITGDSE